MAELTDTERLDRLLREIGKHGLGGRCRCGAATTCLAKLIAHAHREAIKFIRRQAAEYERKRR